jgi:hypothetical protein
MKRRIADGNLRKIIKDNLPQVHWTSIESALTGSGIPDLHGCLNGIDVWIETKWTASWTVQIRPFQIAWLARRARNGGRGFIAIRRQCVEGPRREAADEFLLYKGEDASSLRAVGIREWSPLVRYGDGPTAWPWPKIERTLFH